MRASRLAVQPSELLVVHDDALSREQVMQPSVAEPSANGGQFAQRARTAASSGRRLRYRIDVRSAPSAEHARRSLTSYATRR